MKRFVWVALALAALYGCKAARWRDQEKATSGNAAVSTAPQRVGAADAEPSVAGPSFDVDEKTGKPKADLVLRLDHFPDGTQPGAANLPLCFATFAPDFVVGTVMCDGDQSTKKPLVAGNLRQECYTDPTVPKVPVSVPLNFPDCQSGTTMLVQFTPALRVDADVKDVASTP